MALSAIAMCSRALLKIGAASITSFQDGTAESEIAANLYPSVRDSLLSAHPWNFATAQTTLAKMTAQPVADFANAFQLPADFLRALSAGGGPQSRGVVYRLAEKRLHSDADAVTLSYIFRADEAIFPAFFDQALIARLAAEFCIPLTDSTTRSEMLFKLAGASFREAKTIDSQQATPRQIAGFSLIEAR